MTSGPSDRQIIRRLFDLRNRFGNSARDEKLSLLRSLDRVQTRTCNEILQLHTALCFVRAFPDTSAHHQQARLHLNSFRVRIAALTAETRERLWDSGIAGTPIHYRFSFEVAGWLAKHAPGAATIDREEVDDESRLDDLLTQILHPAEEDFFGSGSVDACDWISLAASGYDGTDFDWLFAQLRESHRASVWSQLYNAADLPLIWNLGNSVYSKTRIALATPGIAPRQQGMRQRMRAAKKEIMRPLTSLRLVHPQTGRKLINVAMTSLAVRHRETNHFNYANPGEVYLADVGEGVLIAVYGLLEKHRYPLECTMGFLILSNGVPVGYGGSSGLFRQVNTGFNIFDEYRGSEASYLWTQVMRVYRQLFGCNRFIANPYQFGSENSEALKSGAFWFHYRLGYRPVESDIRALARAESARSEKKPGYRSNLKTLRRLTGCDMHLTLPGARTRDFFNEQWLETSSKLATKVLAASGETTRVDAADKVSAQVAADLGMRSIRNWTPAERLGFNRLAPFLAPASPATWSADEKESMRKLARTKGGPLEARFAALIGKHDRFLATLQHACRRAER